MFINGSGQNVQSLERTFYRCFLPSFTSFGWGVSEEKIKMWKVNGRRTPSDGKSSLGLWQGELKTMMQFYCQITIRPKKYTKLWLHVEKWSRSVFFYFLHKACWILLFVSFSYRIRQCFYSSTIRLVPCAHFLHQQTISHMRKRFPEWVHCQVVWILHG